MKLNNTKLTKKNIFLVSFLIIIISTYILLKNSKAIGQYLKPYLNENIYIFSRFILDNSNFKKNLNNDYNAKFLPKTELIELDFKKIKLNIEESPVGYLFKNNWKSFFLENFRNYTIVISSYGNFSYIKNSNLIFDNLNSPKELQTNITTNIKFEKILDSYIYDDYLYISFVTGLKNSCEKLNLAKSKLSIKNLDFEFIFSSEDCVKSIQSGKIVVLEEKESNAMLLSTAADVLKDNNEKDSKPQNPNSIWGKILKFENNKNKPKIFTMGHRNILGLLIDGDKIIATENGPAGGDEINLIQEDKNYGWDIASYGTKYSKDTSQFKYLDHEELGFQEPIFAFYPSMGISQIIKLPNEFNENWKNNYLIATLNNRHLLRIKLDKNYNKLIYFEKIFIGERIRDLLFLKDENIILLSLEETGSLGILANIK